MFKIEYRIVISEFEDEISGKNGFIKFSDNSHNYGDIYSKEMGQHMGVESIYYWLTYFMQAVIELEGNKNYILISDIESYNTWLELERRSDSIYTSVIHADKPFGTTAVEFFPVPNIKYTDWKKQETNFTQFKREVMENAKKYYNEICELNPLNHEHGLIQMYLVYLDKLIG